MQHLNEYSEEEQTSLMNRLAEQALKLYDLSPASYCRLLNYSENATYLVEDPVTNVCMVLRLNRPGYHTKKNLESELVWMQDIAEQSSLIVPKPIKGKNYEFVQTLKSQTDSETQHCVMFNFLSGKAPDEEGKDNLIIQFEQLGEVTALLHEHVQQWEDSIHLSRFTWDFETMLGKNPRWGRWQDGPEVSIAREELFQEVADIINLRLQRFGKTRDRFGLIHADLRLANLLIEDNLIKVIDFDDCGYSWFLYDLASGLSFIEHEEFVPELVKSWLIGYRKVRNLSEEEEAEIPTFIMLRRLMLLAWLGSHSDSDTAKNLGMGFAEKTEELARKYTQLHS
ncbi:phosphotransferase [Aneurinibacillus sp. Ricciae_BoGa-3]|uniref:phosphotransferase enzyme family protein n=1 Tax=Aneurinibacillus sp. Ricciae_BoGa-3 TaxID=3022697 RepID=UPI002341CD25|nr:phosphotransferase [Aneurinibacillus sp. Ricciae_BoGa-3]WCK52596.1 phosphotransferase [Aneurinibacillus sp. Ricciae_BoGa-3]